MNKYEQAYNSILGSLEGYASFDDKYRKHEEVDGRLIMPEDKESILVFKELRDRATEVEVKVEVHDFYDDLEQSVYRDLSSAWCPKCNHPLMLIEHFCPNCGQKLGFTKKIGKIL